MDYSNLLREYIAKSGLSLSQIASELNKRGFSTDKGYISKLQNGKIPPAGEPMNIALAEITDGDPDKLNWYAHIEKGPNIAKKVTQFIREEDLDRFFNLQSKVRNGLINKDDAKRDPEYINFKKSMDNAFLEATKRGLIKTQIAKNKELQRYLDGEIPITNEIESKMKETIISYIKRIQYNIQNIDLKVKEKLIDALIDTGLNDIDTSKDILKAVLDDLQNTNVEEMTLLIKFLEKFILDNDLKMDLQTKVRNDQARGIPLYKIYLNESKTYLDWGNEENNSPILVVNAILMAFSGFEMRLNELLLKSIEKSGAPKEVGLDILKDKTLGMKIQSELQKYLGYDISNEPFFLELRTFISLRDRIVHNAMAEPLSIEYARDAVYTLERVIDAINEHAKLKGIE